MLFYIINSIVFLGVCGLYMTRKHIIILLLALELIFLSEQILADAPLYPGSFFFEKTTRFKRLHMHLIHQCDTENF